MKHMIKQLVLASSSPRRFNLLNKLGIPFIVDIANIDETSYLENDPHKLVKKLSCAKAKKVAPKYENAVIIGADTVVYLGRVILGKPKDKNDARRMLEQLSGKKHSVITGYTLLDTASSYQHTESIGSAVYFKKLTTKAITSYINTGEPMDKAGAYAIQGAGASLIERYKGDLEAIIGLPVTQIGKLLKTIP